MANNPLVTQSPVLQIKEISDIHVRKNFEMLQSYFAANNQFLGFNFFEQSFSAATANFKLAHGLNYIPLDAVVTQITGKGTATFNYGLFDKTNIDITTTDACRIRFFIGTYFNQQSGVNANSTDAESFGPVSVTSVPIMVGDTGLGGTAGLAPAPIKGDGALGKFLNALGKYSLPFPASNFLLSNLVNTISTLINDTTFKTTDNSPAFKIIPKNSGTWLIFASLPLFAQAAGDQVFARIFNTSGNATLIHEQIIAHSPQFQWLSLPCFSIYTLKAGQTYQFDTQGHTTSGIGQMILYAPGAPYRLIALQIGV